MTNVLVDCVSLHYVHTAPSVPSPAPPLILVHGAGGNLMHWPRAFRMFAGHSVYAVDLPGHGHSGGQAQKEIGAYAETLRAFCERLSLRPAIICGHSMGGAIGLELALRYPLRVMGLVLLATGARLPVAPWILSGLTDDPSATNEKLAAWAHGGDVDPNQARLYLRRLREVPVEVMRRDFEACDAFDRRADLSRVGVPTLVLSGDSDRMTPLKLSSELADGIPGARWVVLHRAGHMVMLEDPDAVLSPIRSFIDSVSVGAEAS